MKTTVTLERRFAAPLKAAGLSLLLGATLLAAGCGEEPISGDADAGCLAGQVGCVCGDGLACDQGECVAGTCVDCSRGAVGCLCFDNGMCSSGAVCSADKVCQACVDGQKHCPCGTGNACDGELVCQQAVCV
ncbi:MAG: hypothetical protein HY901_09460, partial [Deltaproteobacteria bacterium]|nr:hypothetical protein [Deltaproteobacteria bacterium]